MNDPLVTLSVDEAWKLFTSMLRKTDFTFKPRPRRGSR